MAKNCYGCYFYKHLSSNTGCKKACHFLLETGKIRGCPAEECTHKVSRDYIAKHGKWWESSKGKSKEGPYDG